MEATQSFAFDTGRKEWVFAPVVVAVVMLASLCRLSEGNAVLGDEVHKFGGRMSNYAIGVFTGVLLHLFCA